MAELTDADVIFRSLRLFDEDQLDRLWCTRMLLTHRLVMDHALLFDQLITDARVTGADLEPRCFVRASHPWYVAHDRDCDFEGYLGGLDVIKEPNDAWAFADVGTFDALFV